ncbi:actin cortical patch SUR7/pH-response regulator pali [Lipomyces arxii]|uniref:actin cortical patch SUR7/pH-response regulator pali n=1 Tax=Lipomyces arxii TaxID=56418 RepID=UPI0034CD5625
MAAGRNCFIISFPYVFTIATFVLTILVIIGSIHENSFLRKLYFLEINVPTLMLANDVNFPADRSETLQVGLWNYCIARDGALTCERVSGLFWFDPRVVLSHVTGLDNLNLSDTITKPLSAARPISYVMTIMYCASAIFAVMQFIAGFFSFHSRGGSICTMILAFFTSACIIVASSLATSLYYGEYRAYREFAATAADEVAFINRTTYGITWGAVVASLLAVVFWFFSICFGSTSSHRQRGNPVIYQPVDNMEMRHM